MSEILQRYRKVFSGEDSKDLWEDINAVRNSKIHEALYNLGCHCQKLETIISTLERRIARIEMK